jgi:hypothetical protein
MRSALLVSCQIMPDFSLVLDKSVIDIEYGAARVAEDDLDILLEQAFHQNICAGQSQNTFLLIYKENPTIT